MSTPHKPARQAVACFAALAFLVAPLALRQASAQPNRDRARQHYSNGKHYFNKKKYRLAISEFQQANKLAPSPVLYFNIGLAYDRLGDKRAALSNYQSYLRGVPKAPNRSAVEAKIRRLEGELRAEEAARKAAAAKAAAAEAKRKAAEAEKRRLEEEERKKAAAKKAPIPPPPPGTTGPATGTTTPPSTAPKVATKPPGTTTPDPSTATKQPPKQPEPVKKPKVSTGDPELDKVASIDIGALRAKRDGTSASGATGPGSDTTEPAQRGDNTTKPLSDTKPKKATPAYKQWWFWVVVGVSAIILVDILSTDSSSNAATTRNAPMGATILRF